MLLSAITDDAEIKQGLYPSPGQGTRKVANKTDYQYAVARAIFAGHPTYKVAFARATTPKEKKLWGRKIKNRLTK